MELTLRILLGIVTLICLSGGMNLILKGSKTFLPENTKPLPILDNLFRFLSGIYFGMGFLLAWVVITIQHITDLVYFLGIVILFSGLGRLYSRTKVGAAGKYFDAIMSFEIVLGIVIIVLQYFR